MKRLVVLGAGTAGTMVVNKLHRLLDRRQWRITVVDQTETHQYQPGFLFIPFGRYRPSQVVKPRRKFLPPGVELVLGEVYRVDADASQVRLANGQRIAYDFLVIATGTSPHPEQTPGMLGSLWRTSVFDFYSLDGATALA